MADDTEDLTPFMEHGADYVAAKGAAGAFDPATYGPKQDVKQLPAWMRDATIAPPGVVDALNDAPTDGSKSGSGKFDDILNFMREQQQQTQAEGRATLDEEKRGIRSGIEEIDKQRRSLMATPYPTPQRAPTPPRVDAQAGMQWAQAAALLGAMAGGFVRRGSTAALTAFAAANKGFAQGNQQAFENATAEWKMQAEQVKEDNQARLDQYNAIINQKGKNIDLILGELKLAAQAWNDEMMFNAANSKQTQMIGAMLQKEQEHQDMMEYRFGNQDLANRKLQAQLDAGALGGGRGQIGIMLNKWVAAQSAAGHPPTYEEQERKLLQLNAEMREASNVGNYSAKVETAAIDAQNIIKNVLRASEAVPRGDLVAINSLAQAVAYQGSDPALIALRTHLNALRSVYVRVMNPTSNATEGPRVETHINGLFEAALGPGGLQSQVQAIEQEIESQRSATKQMRDQLGSDAEIPSGESMFERALRDAHAPNRLQDQQGGANVDPYEGITVKVK